MMKRRNMVLSLCCYNIAASGLLLISVLLEICLVRVASYSYPPTIEQRLVNYLTVNYSRLGKPRLPGSTSLQVRTRFFPIKLQSLLEKEEALQMTVRIQLNWKDPALRFNSAMFMNQTSVILPGNSIWVPDLQISNSMSDLYGLLRDPRFDFKVYPDGSVWWHPTGNIATRCEIQLPYFPFDFQRCPIVMESVIYTHDQLNLTLRSDKVPWSTSMYAESGHWNLVGIKARSLLKFVTNSTAFTSVEFWIFLRRKSGYYILNIILPCGMLSVLQMLTFFLPLESSERVPEATTILLSVIVFQSMIIQDLPRSSDALPLLCVYIDLVTGVSVVSVGEAVFIAYLVSRKHERRYCPTWCVPLLRLCYRLRNHEPKLGASRSTQILQSRRGSLFPSQEKSLYDQSHLECMVGAHGPHCENFQHPCHSSTYTEGFVDAHYCCCRQAGNFLTQAYRSQREVAPQRQVVHSESFMIPENRSNGLLPNEDAVELPAAGISRSETQETADNRPRTIKKSCSKHSHRLSRSSSRATGTPQSHRPVLLAPLARQESGSDCGSSECDFNEPLPVGYADLAPIPSPVSLDSDKTNTANPAASCSATDRISPIIKSTSSDKVPDYKSPQLFPNALLPIRDYLNVKQPAADDDGSQQGKKTFSPFPSLDRKPACQGQYRKGKRASLIAPVLVDWLFLAQIVDFVTFLLCLFCIAGVPVLLFGFVPPESPDYNL